jgi:hypothetical protein
MTLRAVLRAQPQNDPELEAIEVSSHNDGKVAFPRRHISTGAYCPNCTPYRILRDSQLPFVLRKNSKSVTLEDEKVEVVGRQEPAHTLVGGFYFHGMMDGKAGEQGINQVIRANLI